MSTDPTPMQHERADLLDECRAILNKADEEHKTLTSKEKRDYDHKWAKAETLKRKIERVVAENNEERADQERRNHQRYGEGFQGATGSYSFVDPESGAETRSLLHNDSFAVAVGAEENRVLPANAAGRAIVAEVTGNWKGCEELRDYISGSDASGGFMLNTQLSAGIIDAARARSVMSKAGAQIVPMATEQLKVVKVETDPTASWIAERAEITESVGTFGAVVLRARLEGVYCEASMEIFRDSSNVQAVVERTIAARLGLGLDEACLNEPGGDGVKPSGLLSSTACDTYAVGGVFTYDGLLNAAGQLWANDREAVSMIETPAIRKKIAKTKDGEARYMPIPPALSNVKRFMSSQVSSTDSTKETIYLGDFSNCIIGLRSGIEIEASGVAGDMFKRKMIAIRGIMRADFAVCRNNDIVKMYGATT